MRGFTRFAWWFALLGVAVLSGSWLAAPAAADPLPGQVLKFQQKPMIATPIDGVTYFGHDEFSTLYLAPPNPDNPDAPRPYHGVAMADDFADRFDTPVFHIRWWGSYMSLPPEQPIPTVTKFLISFESDLPASDTNPFSRPLAPLLTQVVTLGPLSPGSGTFTETPVPGSSPVEPVFEYNAELACPFPQLPDTVYWLKIAALVDPEREGEILWGWHNRDYTIMDPLASVPPSVIPGEHDQRPIVDPGYPTEVWHFQDDAVSALTFAFQFDPLDPCAWNLQQTEYAPHNYLNEVDGPGPRSTAEGAPIHGGIGQFSKDLAFELYTIPEPSTLALLSMGLVALLCGRRLRL
jgi:hypothetical protein